MLHFHLERWILWRSLEISCNRPESRLAVVVDVARSVLRPDSLYPIWVDDLMTQKHRSLVFRSAIVVLSLNLISVH